MAKEVSKSTRRKISDLFIVQQLKKGLRPSQICEEFSLNKKTLQYHLSSLRRRGIINKIGYGVWEIKKELPQKEVSKSTRVGRHNTQKFRLLLRPDIVRGHAFQFVLSLPKNMRNWDRREELLTEAGIKFEPLAHIFGGGQRIILNGNKVHLTNKSIVIYEQESFIADLASESQSHAISHFLAFVKALERHLRADFSTFGVYRFKVTKQHYALIKNALAKQYDKEGKKLQCYAANGLWLEIDNSFNLHELETPHPRTSVDDNEKVQKFFNYVKGGFDAEEVMKEIHDVQKMAVESSKAQMMMSQVMQQMEKNQIRIIKRLGERDV